MKKLIMIVMLLPLLCTAKKVEQYKMREPLTLQQPVFTDSVNCSGTAYDKSVLLDTYISNDFSGYQTSIIEADTAGYVTLAKPETGLAIYMLETSIRPDRYVKGNLKIESDAIYEVFVDGNSKSKKTEAQDSITNESKKTIPLDMLPETEHVITIKVVADGGSDASPVVKAEYVEADEFADVPLTIAPDGKRRFEIRDITLGCKASGVSISPDGRYMLIRYSNRYSKDDNRDYATLTDLRTGKVISNTINPRCSWMPKGATLYYTEKGKNGTDVYGIDVPEMQNRLLIRNVPDRQFTWSPDGEFIIYYKYEENSPEAGPLRRYTNPDDRIPGNRARYFAQIYYPSKGITQPLIYGNRSSSVNCISPDSRKLIMSVNDYDATEWPFYFTSMYQVDIATMKVDTLFTHEVSVTDAVYSPDGKSLFITAGPEAFGKIGKNAGDHPIANESDVQGFLMNIETREIKPMTRDFNPSIYDRPVWNSADGQIYFLAENGFDNTLYRLNPKTGDIRQFPQDITYIQRFSIGNDESQWLVYFGQSYDTAGRVYLMDLKTGKQTLVADPWSEVANDIEWGKLEKWCFTSSDGTEIEGFITYPPGFDPDKKYPMIVYYYGGTSPTKHNVYSQYNAQLFASRGYVVYQLNPSGTTGYGQEFSARHVNAWGDWTAKDIIEGVTKMCDEHPFVDREKVGCIGASYGGFMTELLQTATDIFAAAVSHAGISNVTSYWGEGYWGYSYNALAAAKSYPWTNPDLYTKHGALFNADKIHTPLLMTHGTADTNVPVGESIQLYNALKILGREAELITVDNEDHYISGYDNRIKWQNSVMAWFAKWLQDDPRWWDALYPSTVF